MDDTYNKTVFAIDDEVDILELYASILGTQKRERLGFFDSLSEKAKKLECDLNTFENGEVYLQKLRAHYAKDKRVPISIIDMRLPGKHGIEIAKEARAIDPDMIIIIITAYADYTVDELLSQLEKNFYFLRKPFRDDELYFLIITNLQHWNEKYKAIDIHKELAVDAIEDGLWDWNPRSNEVYYSKRWKEMLGYDDNEIENTLEEWSNRVHPDDLSKVKRDISDHFSHKTQYYINEHRLRCKDGSYKWILDRGKALFDEEDKPYRMTGFHTDISQRKLLEKELQTLSHFLVEEVNQGLSEKIKLNMTNAELEKQLQKEIQIRREKEEMLLQQTRQAAMGEMISMIAHQWRQPLTVISLITDNISLNLQLGFDESTTLESELEDIRFQVSHLSQTIDDFRQFFTPNKEKESVLLQECLENACRIIDSSLKVKNIQLIKIYEDTSPMDLYKNEIMQVFLNIIKNAEDAFANEITSPSITLQTKEYDSYVEVRIADNAGGIDPDILKKIFEPYFTTKGKKHGTGLGLYMSKTIIQEHSSGSIEVKNVDEGAVFIMKFPKQGKKKSTSGFDNN